jgi:hypothetical protein
MFVSSHKYNLFRCGNLHLGRIFYVIRCVIYELAFGRITGSTRVDRAGLYCEWYTSNPCTLLWFCWWSSALGSDAQCRRGRRQRDPVVASMGHPVASAPPSGSVRVWSGELQWRRRTSCPEPVPPTPSYSAAQQGPTSLLTGWTSPIRTRVKGLMGRWAHWWRDQSNILPLDLTIYF